MLAPPLTPPPPNSPRKEIDDRDLQAVWCSVDDDRSGHVTAGEFGAFFKLVRVGRRGARDVTLLTVTSDSLG